MSKTWVSIPQAQAILPRNQDHGVCWHRQIPERRTVCLESAPRCLKLRQMYTEIMVSVAERQGQCAHNVALYA